MRFFMYSCLYIVNCQMQKNKSTFMYSKDRKVIYVTVQSEIICMHAMDTSSRVYGWTNGLSLRRNLLQMHLYW